MEVDVAIVGGGAAGFFAAIHIAKFNPSLRVIILEKNKEVLQKVKVSGGGRCNVTHAEFTPLDLVENYPRGEKELLGPFHSFASGDTMAFFEERGIPLKIEEDGRIFPESDSSQTIIDCFLDEVKMLGVKVIKQQGVHQLIQRNNSWEISTNTLNISAGKIMITTGSSPKVWSVLEKLGHKIVPPVPSLFTFNLKNNRIKALAGITKNVSVKVVGSNLRSEGPLLITHWGLSGPAILKLSAWGARILNTKNYNFKIIINWLYDVSYEDTIEVLEEHKVSNAKKMISNTKPFEMSKRLWLYFLGESAVDLQTKWAEIPGKQLQNLAKALSTNEIEVNGKSTFKEEFVTAGGIDLKEVNFKTYESKKLQGMYFAGEVLNIDAITGGFNFQNAWTGAYIAAKAMASSF